MKLRHGLLMEVICRDRPCDVKVGGKAIVSIPSTRVASAAANEKCFRLTPVRTSLARGETKKLRPRFRRRPRAGSPAC
jgi:hypothetical protein